MTSTKPYLLRAFYQWIVDNELTPHILVDGTNKDAKVPEEYIQDGKVVLNISPKASRDLDLGLHQVEFTARFEEVWDIVVPLSAVIAIYARENGRGMFFSLEDEEEHTDSTQADSSAPQNQIDDKKKSTRPKLKIIK